MYAANEDSKTAGQPLSDFLLQLEDYTPTVASSRILIVVRLLPEQRNKRRFCFRCPMRSANIICTPRASTRRIPECKQFVGNYIVRFSLLLRNDARLNFRVRLVSLAAQKFISEIANDALQHCKTRGANQNTKAKGKDRRYTLTMEDLTPAVAEYGIVVKKPHYFV